MARPGEVSVLARPRVFCAGVFFLLALAQAAGHAAEIYVRAKVLEPPGEKFIIRTGGFRHDGKNNQWYLPSERVEVAGGQWSRWIDLSKIDLHGRLNRSGGVAEWPAVKLSVSRDPPAGQVRGCTLQVQLADRPDEAAAVVTFTEPSQSDTIGFLLPHPLRQMKGEFETGSQMAARHLAWAREASGGTAPALSGFDVITSLWGPYDPGLARQEMEALRLLGFNVVGGAPQELLAEMGMRTYSATWHLMADPEASVTAWQKGEGARIARTVATDEGRKAFSNLAYYVICDEIQTLDFRRVDPARLAGWFRKYLAERGETAETLGRPLESIEYPAAAMFEKTLPRDVDLATRRIMYHAAKFGQFWSVMQLRQTTDLLKSSVGGVRTETLPSDHAFFGAWGPPHLGMGYRQLDLFEIGRRGAVDILSAEDWLGLNHMYGPASTWTGAQSLEYLAAILRSGIGDRPVALRGLITPSDDAYLRLKAYSLIGQGAKSLFFWTYGPTFIGTENYWSDLRSEYDGIARLTRALARAENVLVQARPVSDPVAVLYSVSHDHWHTADPAAFVETRLVWHALRHASVQPDLLREEDIEAGRLAGYRAAYLAGRCLTRRAAAALDVWVRGGGVLYLSAGAATRDEFFEPHLPPFARAVWPDDAADRMVCQTGHAYNERTDLPTIKPLATAAVTLDGRKFAVKVVGCRLDVRTEAARTEMAKKPSARPDLSAFFDDGRPAAAIVTHGKGWVVAAGFMPGLAYSPFKVGQTTLDEVWPEGPRALLEVPLRLAAVRPAAEVSVPVVGASLLTGPGGAALVLANHTHRPIPALNVTVRGMKVTGDATSTEGANVRVTAGPEGGTTVLELPLDVADIVLLAP